MPCRICSKESEYDVCDTCMKEQLEKRSAIRKEEKEDVERVLDLMPSIFGVDLKKLVPFMTSEQLEELRKRVGERGVKPRIDFSFRIGGLTDLPIGFRGTATPQGAKFERADQGRKIASKIQEELEKDKAKAPEEEEEDKKNSEGS